MAGLARELKHTSNNNATATTAGANSTRIVRLLRRLVSLRVPGAKVAQQRSSVDLALRLLASRLSPSLARDDSLFQLRHLISKQRTLL
jgi:hypothetical protein